MAAFMKVVVQLFGPLAEQAGAARLEVFTSGGTVDDVIVALHTAVPGLKLVNVRYAVNTDYAGPASAVSPGDVVSLIPPVGGG